MSQLTFSEAEFVNEKHKTRREVFLDRMEKLTPWKRLEKQIAKHYPKGPYAHELAQRPEVLKGARASTGARW